MLAERSASRGADQQRRLTGKIDPCAALSMLCRGVSFASYTRRGFSRRSVSMKKKMLSDLLVEALDAFDEPSLLFTLDRPKKLSGILSFRHDKVWHTTCFIASSENKTRREVTNYGPAAVDHLSSVPRGRSAQLGLSLVWLCSLGHRRGCADCPRHFAPNRPTLKGNERRTAIRLPHTPSRRNKPLRKVR